MSQLPIGQVETDINGIELKASLVVPAAQTATLHLGAVVTAVGLDIRPTSTYALNCYTSGSSAQAGRASLTVLPVGDRLTVTG